MYFDSHSHMDSSCFDAERDDLIRGFAAKQVEGFINIGCDLESSCRSVALAEAYPFVWAAVGSHPDDAGHVDEALVEQYRQLASHKKVVAIGEIGLDYHYEDVPRDIQKQAFEKQLKLAHELNLPVIVHEREAHADAMEIIDRYPDITGVFHCYSGSLEMTKELVKRGWYIGFTGVVTFKNARKAVEVVKWLPLDRILIETDCPYMAPEPFRGRRNDTGLVPLVGKAIAAHREEPEELVMQATTENAKRLFRIP